MDSDQEPGSPTTPDSMGDPDKPMSTFQRDRKRSGVHYDSPPTGQPIFIQRNAEDTLHESEDELDDVDPPQEDPPLQAEDDDAPATEDFPPPPESMALEKNEEMDEETELTPEGSDERTEERQDEDEVPSPVDEEENEPEMEAEGDTTPLVNEETDPPHVVVVTDDDHDDDIELEEVTEPEPQPAQENANRPGQSLTHVPSVRARYVQRDIVVESDDKLRHNQICCTGVCLLLLASIIACLVAVVWLPTLEPGLPSSTVTEGSDGTGDLVLAEVMVTLDLNFTDYLYDPSSSQYQELSKNYSEWIQQTLRETSFARNAYGAFVNGFRPGSVIVHSSVFFNLSGNILDNLQSSLGDELNRRVNQQGTSSVLPVTAVTVGEVIRSSEDTKIPIEIFPILSRPPTPQQTVRPNQPTTTTQMANTMNSTITPSSNVSQSLGNNATSSVPTSLDTGMTYRGTDNVTPTGATNTDLPTAASPGSNITNGVSPPIATT